MTHETKHTPGPIEAINENLMLRLAEKDVHPVELSRITNLKDVANDLLTNLEICANFGKAMADATDDPWLKEAVLQDVNRAYAALAKARGQA